MADFEFTDRYQALGIPYPDPKTVCEGQCEGTGAVPHYKGLNGEVQPVRQEGDEVFDALWDEAHAKPHAEKELIEWCGFGDRKDWPNCKNCVVSECDGWHFLKCPDCNGTGKKH